MPNQPATVEDYLSALPTDRRDALNAVRRVILANIDDDCEEGLQYGMIGYYIPHWVYPAGYHCDPTQPLTYAALGARKNYLTLSLMPVYGHGELAAWFRDAWAKAGKKLNMGAACIQFKKLDDLPLEVIAEAIRRVPPRKFLAYYQSLREAMRKPARKKTAVKKVTKRKSS
ncbi:MAG: DUF1801 domain-containing protein [Planctomycetaceae bacterium]|nr:DUF1801 domain-containing protein [Planctomycetaceae bacterium]